MTMTPETQINTALHQTHVALSELDRCEQVPVAIKESIREACFVLANAVRLLPCMPPAPEDRQVV